MIPVTVTVVVLRLQCSWCRRVLVEGTPGAATSHGICPPCVEKLFEDVA
jgi:hypothetical protein